MRGEEPRFNVQRAARPRAAPGARLRREVVRLGAGALLGLVLAVLYALFAPRWYQAKLLAVPVSPKAPSLSLTADNGSGTADVDLSANGDVDRIVAILQSSAVSTAVIHQLNLTARYGTPFADRAQAALWSHCAVTADRKAKMVTLVCEDQDPQFARDLTLALGERGNEALRSIGISSSGEEARFLERRVAEVAREAEEAAQKLRDFEEEHHIVDLDAQSRAVVSAISSLRGQQISKELELRYMHSYSSPRDSSASQVRRQLAAIDGQLQSLVVPEPGTAAAEPNVAASAGRPPPRRSQRPGPDMFPAAVDLPELQYELSQRLRDRNLSEQNLLLLRQRLEVAKATAASDISAFQVVDPPAVPSTKHRPRGSIAVATGLALGLIAGALWAFAGVYVASARRWLREESQAVSR